MADAPSAPWMLSCPWCEWSALVSGRGMRSNDLGAGVEAARLGEQHAAEAHGKTWREFIEASLG